jgi:hypothetical protein
MLISSCEGPLIVDDTIIINSSIGGFKHACQILQIQQQNLDYFQYP